MSGDRILRNWILERRKNLCAELLEDIDRTGLRPRNKRVSELTRLRELEQSLDQENKPKPDWRWWLLAYGMSCLLLILLTRPHYEAGELSLSAQATGIRLKPAEFVELGPKSLILDGFKVEEVRGVASALDPLGGSLNLDLSGGVLQLGDQTTLARIGYGRGSELVVEVVAPNRLIVFLEGADVYVEVTPNGSPMWVPENAQSCRDERIGGAVPSGNVRLATETRLEVRLRRLAKASGSETRNLSLIRSANGLELLTFDTRSDQGGLATGRRSHLMQANIQLGSFGGETLSRHWGQGLRLMSVSGFLHIGVAGGSLQVNLNGECKSIFGSDEEALTPSILAWLWQNKVIALYLSAFLAFGGFLANTAPSILERIGRRGTRA